MEVKKQITYCGEIVITEKNITKENMNNERYNDKPIYEIIPFECQATDYVSLKQRLFIGKIYKSHPTNTYIHNLKIHRKKIAEFFLDYHKGYCARIGEREEIVNKTFSSQYMNVQEYATVGKKKNKNKN